VCVCVCVCMREREREKERERAYLQSASGEAGDKLLDTLGAELLGHFEFSVIRQDDDVHLLLARLDRKLFHKHRFNGKGAS
jgi:hypothetical protein